MSIGERIRTRREELGLSQAELAKRIGVTQGSIGNYESGVSNPKMELMQKLFDALETDANYIFHEVLDVQRIEFTYDETMMIQKYRTLDEYGKKAVDVILETEFDRCLAEEEEKAKPFITIHRHLNKASAGYGYDLNNRDEWKKIKVVDEPAAQNADFAVEVEGDSMLPDYQDGDLVLIVIDTDVPVGKVGLFRQGDKGYIKERGEDRLISRNPDYEDIYGEVECIGRVIGVAKLPE